MRLRRIAGALAAGFVLGTFAWPVGRAPPLRPAVSTVSARAVLLDAGHPQRRRLGALIYLEGWQLSSPDTRFGGISSMHVEGDEVTALSDAGTVFRFRVPQGDGAQPLRIQRLPRGPGRGRRKSDRDVEAMVVAGGHAWLAFEGRNAIWRYRRAGWAPEAAASPAAMDKLPHARGPEAMARLADGRFLVIAEGPLGRDGTTPMFLFAGDPALPGTPVTRLRYRPPAGYRPTDAAPLPDGRLLVLNRNVALFGWWQAVLTLEGRAIAWFTGSATRDNMEALSVTREGGRTIVWIASDDNFNPLLQRTLLMKFALAQ